VIPTLLELSTSQLRALAAAAGRGAFEPPVEIALSSYCPAPLCKALGSELDQASAKGLRGELLAMFLATLANDRERRAAQALHADLVWTGPEVPVGHSRDTRIVVHELFRKARKSVLLSTYALYDGKDLFTPLYETWEQYPTMTVRLFLDVKRGDTGLLTADLLAKFRSDFRNFHWPWERLPAVYYDPRSLAPNLSERACLHAKCVIVDDRDLFLTSANLTEAAQQRNIEAGLVLASPVLAAKVRDQFLALVVSDLLARLF
jgi:phosphatidylserine/phosphatidylglycerophosphate/cardiolipin synthase-like enzyme